MKLAQPITGKNIEINQTTYITATSGINIFFTNRKI